MLKRIQTNLSPYFWNFYSKNTMFKIALWLLWPLRYSMQLYSGNLDAHYQYVQEWAGVRFENRYIVVLFWSYSHRKCLCYNYSSRLHRFLFLYISCWFLVLFRLMLNRRFKQATHPIVGILVLFIWRNCKFLATQRVHSKGSDVTDLDNSGLSESSLGTQIILLVLLCTGWNDKIEPGHVISNNVAFWHT